MRSNVRSILKHIMVKGFFTIFNRDCPHKDILDQDGNIVRKTWFEFLDNKQALDLAVKDLKDNHGILRSRPVVGISLGLK